MQQTQYKTQQPPLKAGTYCCPQRLKLLSGFFQALMRLLLLMLLLQQLLLQLLMPLVCLLLLPGQHLVVCSQTVSPVWSLSCK